MTISLRVVLEGTLRPRIRRDQGRNILMIFETLSRKNWHFKIAEEHLWHKTWPQGTMVISTSEVKQTRQSQAAFVVSASLAAASDFSCKIDPETMNKS